MISGIEEIRDAKAILAEVQADLKREGIAMGEDVEIGAMIEVPSAVVMASALASEVDFFSIGTNDLIQYVLAIDRINERVSYLYEPLHPAVLRMIRYVVEEGHRAGIHVSMCGEMAGEPAYIPILLGLGLDELSMNPLAIPRMKMLIQSLSREESQRLLNEAMAMASSAEIAAHVEAFMSARFPNGLTCAQ
jgi:phosphotransferase system enzyme I (PtsI)